MTKSVKAYVVGVAQKGGRARAKKLTAERRREIARRAAQTRWGKRKRQA